MKKYEKYLTPGGLVDLEELSYSHPTDNSLAKILRITSQRLDGWCRIPEIYEAIERGRVRANKVTTPLPPVKEKREVLEDMLAWCDPVGVMG